VPSLTEIVRPTLDDPAVCVVRGEVDISNVAELRAGLAAAFDASPAVVVDLADVAFMASAGVRALVEAGTRPGRRMAIVVGPGVATILRICGMARIVPCAEDRAGAERACRG
jgi:anti-anti-sigma factor